MKQSLISLALLLFLAGVLYSPSLNYPFIWDDIKVIRDNVFLRTSVPPTLFFQPRFWSQMVPISRVDYRPLQMLALKVVSLQAGSSPLPFRLTNIVVHLLITILVWLLAACFSPKNRFPFWAAAFFAFHPVHVEAVVNARNISELLVVAFMLGALLIFIRSSRWPATLLACLFFLLALLCKENALVFPFLLIAYITAWVDRGHRSASFLRTLPFWLLFAASAAWKVILMAGGETGQDLPSFSHCTVGAAKLMVIYLRLLAFPLKLATLYPFSKPSIWTRPEWFLSLVVISAVVTAGLSFWRKNRFPAWLLLSLLIALLPNLAKIGQIGRMVAEQRTYFASVFFCILLAYLFDRPAGSDRNRFSRIALPAAALLCLLYVGLTREYLAAWKDTFTLWSRVTRLVPNSALGHNNLAISLHRQGRDEEAIREWQEAARLQPYHKEAHNNLGVLYRERGQWKKAAAEFKKSLKKNPSYHPAALNLAEVYLNLHQLDRAEEMVRKVLVERPCDSGAYNELAIVLEHQGEYLRAEEAYLKAAELNPESAMPLRNLVGLLQESGESARAIEVGEKAIERDPDNPAGYLALSRVYIAAGNFSEARALLGKAAELAPGNWEIKSRLWSLKSYAPIPD